MTQLKSIGHSMGVCCAVLAVVLATSTGVTALAADADVAAFYKGKKITWLSGFNRGGYVRTAGIELPAAKPPLHNPEGTLVAPSDSSRADLHRLQLKIRAAQRPRSAAGVRATRACG